MRLALVSALLLAGCSAGPLVRDAPDLDTPTGYPNHSTAQVIEAVAMSVAPVLSIAADGDLDVSSDAVEQGATFSLRARLADSVTVVVRGPLGIVGGRGLATPDSFYAADRINDVYLLGPISAAERFVPGVTSAEQATRAALGLLVPEPGLAWTQTAADGTYRLIAPSPAGGALELTVDPSVWRVVRVRQFGADGRQRASQTAEAFDTVDGVVLPRRVTLEGEGTVIRLEHRRLVVNPADLRLRFTPPEGYETIRF